MSETVNRRHFLRGSLMAGAAGFIGLEERTLQDAMAQGAGDRIVLPPHLSPATMPTGKLGSLTISRVVSGGNLLGGWAHSRDLLYVSPLMRAYNTEQKQHETFELLEQAGVNTVQVDLTQVEQVNKYKRERGGKLQIIASVRPLWGLWNQPAWDEIKKSIDLVIDMGVDTVYIHGGYADQLVKAAVEGGRQENIPYIGKIIEYVRAQGLPSGLGSHALEVPIACDREGIEPDYYFKTFHHDRYWSATPRQNRKPFSVDADREIDHGQTHDNIFDLGPEETAAYMMDKKQPWFAFKTLAAGAIDPESGFRYAFEHGADFIVVGMFDFQVVQNLTLATEILNDLEDRRRPWQA